MRKIDGVPSVLLLEGLPWHMNPAASLLLAGRGVRGSVLPSDAQQAATKVTNSISLLWQQFLQPLKVAALKAVWLIIIDTYTRT